MGDNDKTGEQLAEELSLARKRVAELENAFNVGDKPSTVDYNDLKTFFDSATDSFSIWDSNLNLLYINDATLKYHPAGTKKSDVIGKNIKELIPDSDKSGRYEKYRHVRETGEQLVIEDFKADPKYGDTYLSIKVFKINDGIGIISSDITERKRMEQKLRASQQRLNTLIDNAPDIVLTYDTNGRFISGNKRAEELLGYTIKDKLGKTFEESGIFTAESLVKAKQRLESYKQGEATGLTPYELIAKDGSHLFVEVRGVPIVDGTDIEVIAIARDITERKNAEEALRNSEEKLRAVFESIGDSITIVDIDGNITDLNDAAVKLFGCKSKEEVLGMSGLTFIVEENRPPVIEAIPVRCVQYKFRRMDGSTFWGETASDVLYDKSGDITGFIAIVRDITERKKTEEALRQSEERYRRLSEDMPAFICTFLPDSTLTYVNKAYCDYFQKSSDELIGARFLDFLPAEKERRRVKRQYESLSAENPVLTYEHTVLSPDGSNKWQQWTDRALFDYEGRISGYQSIGFDITERKRIEETLRQSEEKFRVIFNCIGDGISVIDLTTGKVIDTNEAALHMFNFDREDVIGMNAYELIATKDRQRAMEDLVKTVETGDSGLAEWCLLGKGGSEHGCEARASVIRDSSGNPLYLVNVIRDISERKLMYQKLQESEEKLRRVIDSLEDGLSVTDLEGIVLDVNEKALELSGYSREEFIGKFGLELLVERDRPRAMQDMLESFNSGYGDLKEYTSLTKDGREFPVEGRSTVLYDADGKPTGLVSTLRDITERKQMEERLKRSEERIRQVFNSVGVGITVTDTEGKVIDVNDFELQLGGYSKEELLGSNGIRVIAERDRPRIVTEMIETFQTGRSNIQEFTALKNDGSEYEVEAIATVLGDSSGKPTGLIISITDISERKRIEKELNDHKENLERMVQARTAELAAAYIELQNSEKLLRTSEEKLRTMFASMADGVVVTDMEGKLVDINEAQLKLFGYDKEEVLGMNGFDFIAERDRGLAVNDMSQFLSEGFVTGRTWTFLHSSGKEFQAELSTALLKDANGNPSSILVVMRDITERKRMEEALRDSEEWHRALVETSGRAELGIAIIQDIEDRKAALVFVNDESCKISGYSQEELLSMSVGDLIPPDAIEQIMRSYTERRRGDSIPHTYETVFMRKDNIRVPVMASIDLMHMHGKPATVAFFRDITERKHMEEALRASEEKLRATFEAIADGIAVADLNGKLIDMNTADLKLFGYESKDQLTDLDALSFVAAADRDRVVNDIASVAISGHGVVGEYRLVGRYGEEFDAEIRGSALLNKDGETIAIVNVIRDVTERKRIEEALRKSEEKLRTMFSSMADGVIVIGLDGKVKDINDALLHLFEHDSKEAALNTDIFSNFISEEDRESALKDMRYLLTERIPEARVFRFAGQKGRELIAEVHTSLLLDDSGNPTDIMCVVRDITERKHMEEALRVSEEKLRAIYNSIGDGITVTDLKGNILDLNEAGLRFSGYGDKEEAIGRNGLLFISETDRDRARNDMFNVLQKGIGITTEYRLADKEGREFDAEVSGAMISDADGNASAIVNVVRDITERKRIEQALVESEAKYRTLVEQSEQGICVLQNGRVVFANNGLAKINGYSLKEMYAMSPDELLQTIHPDDREAFVERVKRRLRGEKMMPRHEYKIIRKDGVERQLETFTKRITYKGQTAIQSTIEDITERKQWEAQLRESREELRFYLNQITRAQEEERKRIARELHDDTIQELITLSRDVDDLIERKIKPEEDRRVSRKKIEAARRKVDAILQSVRQFTRDLRPSVLDDLGLIPALEWLTTDMSKRFEVPVNISIVGSERPTSPEAALAIFRVAQESIRNAGQHSKASQIQINLKFTARTVTLSVIDDGVGFTPPKQTSDLTKVGKLGVAGMYERAQLIEATISIKSKRNKGTTVTLEVPIK